MSACKEWSDRLIDFALGGGSESRAVEMHLEVCAECRAAAMELKTRVSRMDTALRQQGDAGVPAEGFDSRLAARIEAGQASWWRVWRGSTRMRLAAAVAVCAVVVTAAAGPRIYRAWHGESVEPAITISTWQSPTESLLRMPGQELVSNTPRVGDFYFPLQGKAKRMEK